MNRRKFLSRTMSGLGSTFMANSLIDFYLLNLYQGFMHRAYALESQNGFNEMKLVNVAVYGGLPGWLWSLPLKPNGDADPFSYGFQTNDPKKSMLWTKFIQDTSAPGGQTGCYDHVKVGDWYLPYLWSGSLARPDNQSDQMSKLAQNMLVMRGLRYFADDHEGNRYLQVRPDKAMSLGGYVADRSVTPIPAIGHEAGVNYFKSAKGISQLQLSKGSAFSSAFSTFKSSGQSVNGSSSVHSRFDHVLDLMKSNSSGRSKFLPTSYQARIAAKSLMLKDFISLEEQFNSIKAKYQSLIQRSISGADLRLNGVDNVEIPGVPSKLFRISTSNSGKAIYYTGSDLRNSSMNADIPFLAEQFAISEVMLTGGGLGQSLTSSINIMAFGGFYANADQVQVEDGGALPGGMTQRQNYNYYFPIDSHYVGPYPHLVLHSRYLRALSSCLYEFILKLKGVSVGSGNLFDKTVVAVTSEFNRNNDQLQIGTNHGYTGSNYTLFSGMISKTTVIGNIKPEAGLTDAGGTWGDAAHMRGSVLEGTHLGLGNAISTVSTLLEIPSPSPNHVSLVYKNPSTGKAVVPEEWSTPENRQAG